ncbi:S10 family peptidase [Ponticaulis profundi]|uniref:S10 family peptidase n=1 Tax=Ponticaulis profundi TaxID=2665222 RepID=A0ABW1S7S5_9PROT
MTCFQLRSAGVAFALLASTSGLVAVSDPVPSSVDTATSATTLTRSVTQTGVFGGTELTYLASIEQLDVQADVEGKGASLVTISYVSEETADPAERPVLFIFNGGPISASYPLHIGATGPYRVSFDDDLSVPAEEADLVPNPYSPLDVADLVFYDPALTGLSTLHDGVSPETYASVTGDAEEFVEFVHAWLTKHDRLDSPVFILGESYGTMRAAEGAGQLNETYPDIDVDGVFLMGQAVNIIEYAQRQQNILSFVVSLPTLAAGAWDLGLVEQDGYTFESFLDEATAFADTEYLTALYKGHTISAEEQVAIAEKLEAYTGLSKEVYVENNLRVSKEAYRRLVLKADGLITGRSDIRYTANAEEAGAYGDPSGVIGKAYADGFAEYFEMTFGTPLPESYTSVSGYAGTGSWDWKFSSPFDSFAYGDAMNALFEANPDFRVVIGSGWHDTQTTAGSARYLASQSPWPADRVHLAFYRGGHMAYSVEESAEAFGQDIRDMITGQSGTAED